MKKTPWFEPSVKPAREGVYQIRYAKDPNRKIYWALWNGSSWCAGYGKFCHAENETRRGGIQEKFWRGLQGDEHSCQIGASTYAVEFSEGPDRPGDDE